MESYLWLFSRFLPICVLRFQWSLLDQFARNPTRPRSDAGTRNSPPRAAFLHGRSEQDLPPAASANPIRVTTLRFATWLGRIGEAGGARSEDERFFLFESRRLARDPVLLSRALGLHRNYLGFLKNGNGGLQRGRLSDYPYVPWPLVYSLSRRIDFSQCGGMEPRPPVERSGLASFLGELPPTARQIVPGAITHKFLIRGERREPKKGVSCSRKGVSSDSGDAAVRKGKEKVEEDGPETEEIGNSSRAGGGHLDIK